MTYYGGDPDGLRRLCHELRLAGAGMAVSRAAIERTMNEVCMLTTVPADVRRIESWVDETAVRVDKAITTLDEEDARPKAVPGTVSGFPNDVVGDCGRMDEGIGGALDVLVKRVHDLRADVNNLRVLKPTGTNSFKGHVDQATGRKRQLEKQLETWDDYNCPGSITVDVARKYVEMDIAAEVGLSAAAFAAASAARPKGHDWWDVDIHVDPRLAKVGAVAAALAAAAAALARDVTTGNLALG